MRQLNKELYDLAQKGGCCDEWLIKIAKSSEDNLLELYRNGMDFNIEKKWISDDDAKRLFNPEIRHKHGIYIGEDCDLTLGNGIYVFKGLKCKLKLNRFTVSTIYILDGCDAKIDCEDFSHAFIHLYDSTLNVSQEDVAKVFVYDHTNSNNISYSGDVRIRAKYTKVE